MKPVFFAISAILLYAAQNVIIERKLAQVSPVANLVFFYVATLAFALPIVIFREQFGLNLTMPQGNQCWFIALCGILLFFADWCFFSAYHSGGSLITITTIVILLPVFASLMKFALDKQLPAITQIIGYVFAVAAVILVSKK